MIADDMRETGMSLADIASFVEEVERREGWTPRREDGRGIDRMRKLAKRLEEHGQSESATSKPVKSKLMRAMGLEPTKLESTRSSVSPPPSLLKLWNLMPLS